MSACKADNVYELETSERDGVSCHELFERVAMGRGFTFDDLILLPGSIDFGVHEVELSSQLTKNIRLNLPLVSSPMDSVTESKMAIMMALHGGLGFIHSNNSIEEQAAEVRLVKRFRSGFITRPHCIPPWVSIETVDSLAKETGFTSFPVTKTGKMKSKLLGILTSRDVDFVEDRTKSVEMVMTPLSQLAMLPEGCNLDEAHKKMLESRKGKMPVCDAEGNLVSLVSRKDVLKNRAWPNATKHPETDQLLVGASVGSTDLDKAKMRVAALAEAGVDVLVLDWKSAGFSNDLKLISYIKETFPRIEVISSNAVTEEQVHAFAKAGVDGVRVGLGVASVATGQLIKATGRPQMSAVYHTARVAAKYNIPIVADGGISNSGGAIKALCLGAGTVMMGALLAGTEESPGTYYFQDGLRLKKYRGANSHEALTEQGYSLGHHTVSTGVSGAVVDKGSVRRFLPYFSQSIRHGLQDLGTRSIKILHEQLYAGILRFEVRSSAAQREGGVHDLHVYQRNYVH